ncbi:MAG: hypothetical protein L0287_32350 [Anaerolineae bacterium]|nr:hypothetical protein [Anaerolineae bacterium]
MTNNTYSIYAFWQDLANKKTFLRGNRSFREFPFNRSLFSSSRRGKGFPTFSIRVNNNKSAFTGGELVKIKTRNRYSISPFKSSIPTGRVKIRTITDKISRKNTIRRQMEKSGDNIFSLEERDVYYLIHGRKGINQKICLVHGSFFETIDVKDLIRQSFAQVLEDKNISDEEKKRLNSIFSEEEDFSHLQNVESASVKLKFRILTEVKPEGNILNSRQYPEIVDDSLNLVVPFHNEDQKLEVIQKMETVVGKNRMKKLKIFPLKHPLNGWFVVFQVNL